MVVVGGVEFCVVTVTGADNGPSVVVVVDYVWDPSTPMFTTELVVESAKPSIVSITSTEAEPFGLTVPKQ